MILALIVSISMTSLNCTPDTGTCGLLRAILEDSVSTRVFKLNRHPELSIRFLDSNGQIDSCCTLKPVFGKKVEIIRKPAHDFPMRTLDIMVQRVEGNGKKYKVHYFQPSTGAVGYILLRKGKTAFKVTKVIYTQY